jgi:hypothetical protein
VLPSVPDHQRNRLTYPRPSPRRGGYQPHTGIVVSLMSTKRALCRTRAAVADKHRRRNARGPQTASAWRVKLFADPNGWIRPRRPVLVPYRLPLRPIAGRPYIHRWRRRRRVIARPGDCGSDNGSGGQATYESGRYAPTVASAYWRGGDTGEGQRRHCGWHDR